LRIQVLVAPCQPELVERGSRKLVGRGKRGSGWSQMISLALEFEKHGSN